jgi:hypothetical protein
LYTIEEDGMDEAEEQDEDAENAIGMDGIYDVEL